MFQTPLNTVRHSALQPSDRNVATRLFAVTQEQRAKDLVILSALRSILPSVVPAFLPIHQLQFLLQHLTNNLRV